MRTLVPFFNLSGILAAMMSDAIPPGTDELFLLFLHRDLLLPAVTSHSLADRTQSGIHDVTGMAIVALKNC